MITHNMHTSQLKCSHTSYSVLRITTEQQQVVIIMCGGLNNVPLRVLTSVFTSNPEQDICLFKSTSWVDHYKNKESIKSCLCVCVCVCLFMSVQSNFKVCLAVLFYSMSFLSYILIALLSLLCLI